MSNPYIYPHPLAICTLDDAALQATLSKHYNPEGIIVAPLRTENLGIEQIIAFALEQPALRTIILCGQEPNGPIGSFSGGTLVALKAHGTDEHHRIIHAPGKRPILQNITLPAIEHFRQQVTLVDAIGCSDVERLIQQVDQCRADLSSNPPRPITPFTGTVARKLNLPTLKPAVDGSIVSDPAGYVVINVDGAEKQIAAKHYNNNGCQTATITGNCAKAIYTGLIELKAVSRLDHAAYLGKELARAETTLKHIQSGDHTAYFVQDAEGP